MRFFKTLAVCAVVLSGLVGCASTEPQTKVQGVQRVGVASVIGEKLQYRQIAIVALGNDSEAANIAGWGFDEYIEGTIAQTLAPQYAVEGIHVDRTHKKAEAIALAAASQRMGNPLDAYIVIVPAQRAPSLPALRQSASSAAVVGGMGGFIGGAFFSALTSDVHSYEGLGLYREPNKKAQYVYAVADIVLVDGRTYQELRRTPLYALNVGAGEEEIEGAATYEDMRQVNEAERWPDDFAAFTPRQFQEISDQLAIFLRLAVGHSLRQIGLTY